MLGLRAVLAAAMVVIGAVIIYRMFSMGLTAAIIPGVVLGAAMIALGLYRFQQIRQARTPR